MRQYYTTYSPADIITKTATTLCMPLVHEKRDIEIKQVLVFGAGVLGSLYAAWLHRAGFTVTLLARGERLRELDQHGIVLRDFITGKQTTTHVRIVDKIPREEHFDLCLVFVRKDQLDEALTQLVENRGIRTFAFMNNTAEGPEPMIRVLGRERVLMGHANAGGERREHEVLYIVTDKMTLGEPDGSISPRVREIAKAMCKAGFPCQISTKIDAWKRYHVALAVPFAYAMYRNDTNRLELANNCEDLKLCLLAMRECFGACKSLRIPMTPFRLRVLFAFPDILLIKLFRMFLRTRTADIGMERHLRNASDEMRILAKEMRKIIDASRRKTPALDTLRRSSPLNNRPRKDIQHASQ